MTLSNTACTPPPPYWTSLILGALMAMMVPASAGAQSSSNTCGTNVANQYPVGSTCTPIAFNKPSTYTAAYNPGGCNSSNRDDAYGWFQATSTETTVRYTPQSGTDGILHVLAACGGAVVGCSDVAGAGGTETVTIPTVIGTNYYVRVQRYGSSNAMDGTLCIFNSISCTYTLTLYDSNANGWGSSSVAVYINGVLLGTYSLTSGYYSGYLDISVFQGDMINLVYNNSGPNQAQNSYTLTSCSSDLIFTAGPSPAAGSAYNAAALCPTSAQSQDCLGGATLCTDQSITNNSTSSGCRVDLNGSNRGCLLSDEQQGTWYYFSPSASGTLGFTLTPQGAGDDYDFALWGPFDDVHCPNVPPARCSYYDGAYYANTVTGMGNGATDASEGAYSPPGSNNGWVQTLNVIADKVYVLYIDNYSSTGQAFTLDWNLTNGASLDCSTLPVELISLEATSREPVIDVTWATATEHNSNYFTVERSPDNSIFTAIGNVGAAGDAQYRNDYLFTDSDPFMGANYYRLRQVDRDGASVTTHTVVAFRGQGTQRPVIFPNPAEDVLNVAFASPLDGTAVLYVQDALGRTVAETGVVVLRGEHTATIPTDGLSRGWYSLRIALSDGSSLPGTGFLKK